MEKNMTSVMKWFLMCRCDIRTEKKNEIFNVKYVCVRVNGQGIMTENGMDE